MAIEVTSVVTNKTVEKIEFPVLMIAKSTGQVVLFSSETEGTVIVSGESVNKQGLFYNRFVSCYDNLVWQKYEESITLKNK